MYQPCAAVDIGSATVHLLIARLSDAGKLETYHEESVRPLLGARRTSNGMIPPDAADEVLAALRRYQRVAAEFGVYRLLVVATEAVRAAANGGEVVTRWQDALSQPIAVLTTVQETRLAMYGAYAGTLPEAGLFADSGGASTQVAVIAGRAVLWQCSLPIGASGLTSAYLRSDPPTTQEVATADGAVWRALTALPSPSAPTDPAFRPVITGGTASTLQALALPGCTAGTVTTACLTSAALAIAAASAFISESSSPVFSRGK